MVLVCMDTFGPLLALPAWLDVWGRMGGSLGRGCGLPKEGCFSNLKDIGFWMKRDQMGPWSILGHGCQVGSMLGLCLAHVAAMFTNSGLSWPYVGPKLGACSRSWDKTEQHAIWRR